MREWLAGLPIHRKLVALALLVSTAALIVGLVGLTFLDVYRFHGRAEGDAATLAALVAENSAAAVAFQDDAAAAETLSTVRIRDAVTRACIYLEDGSLFAAYERDASLACPAGLPAAERPFHAAATRRIVRNGRSWGVVYVERDSSGLAERIGLAAGAAAVMLVVAGALALLLAQVLTRTISDPIVRLAAEARRVGMDAEITVPDIPAQPDEVGDLVRAFQGMLQRVRDANAGLLREIEERRKVEAEREALLRRERETSRLKDEFVATVSHELRTPLGAILGWTQVLEAAPPDPRTLEKAISAISRSAEAQARIIEDLVDVSRIAAGKLHLHWETTDLRIAAQGAVDVMRATADAREVRIDLAVPASPCLVRGDPDRLRQVASNLVSNAVKFSEPGGRTTVVVRVEGAWCELEVADDGVGIEPDMLAHVFDRYRQADGSTTRRYDGLGIGLSIVKEVTELHGGSVSVRSEGVGLGSTFVVRLPAILAKPDPGTSEARPPVRDASRLDGVSVLAVDDNADALDIMATALRVAGATVRTASSGPSALDAWEHDPPDVLLCDIAMPGMDGFGVLAQIRERDARAARRTAAIAVSAHATAEHRERCLAAGFSAHIAKPYRVAELVHAVNDALDE